MPVELALAKHGPSTSPVLPEHPCTILVSFRLIWLSKAMQQQLVTLFLLLTRIPLVVAEARSVDLAELLLVSNIPDLPARELVTNVFDCHTDYNKSPYDGCAAPWGGRTQLPPPIIILHTSSTSCRHVWVSHC